jgi:uncharacterized integral membrane protein
MAKMLITIAVTMILVLFGMQNSDHVPVSLIAGIPKQVRLVFLLGVAASSGFMFSYIRRLGREAALKKEVLELRRLCKEALGKLADLKEEIG